MWFVRRRRKATLKKRIEVLIGKLSGPIPETERNAGWCEDLCIYWVEYLKELYSSIERSEHSPFASFMGLSTVELAFDHQGGYGMFDSNYGKEIIGIRDEAEPMAILGLVLF